jgi:predicted SAM-dependent methyltransferase
VTQPAAMPVRRLNWGCGNHVAPGWINADRKGGDCVDICSDIRQGLPLETGSIDYVVSIHALPEVPLAELVPVLGELRRVLRPEGVLRLALPDLARGVAAYQRHDRDYFLVPDEHASSLGGKLVTQLLWYGYSNSLFTADFVEELLLRAGFSRVFHCSFGETFARYPEIVALDNRPDESLFVEGVK